MIFESLALLAAAAAQAPAPRPLLASELVWEERAPRRRASWAADPMLAPYPEIVRWLRRRSVPAVREDVFRCEGMVPCYQSIRHELAFAGTRLVSIFAERRASLGGSHAASEPTSIVWDRARRAPIRFGDIFVSWQRARPLLQTRLCAALVHARPDETNECPAIDEVALGLADGAEAPVGGPASAFEARTGDYQLGSKAAGRETVFIDVDPELLALVRPEYRAEFALPD
jgi:hypothetical protein